MFLPGFNARARPLMNPLSVCFWRASLLLLRGQLYTLRCLLSQRRARRRRRPQRLRRGSRVKYLLAADCCARGGRGRGLKADAGARDDRRPLSLCIRGRGELEASMEQDYYKGLLRNETTTTTPTSQVILISEACH